jgi:hypothetical protein
MTPDEFHALQKLANVPRGIAKTLMSAYGFNHDLIASLVLEGFATVVPDMARIGEQTIDVELVMITDAGRRALDDLIARDRRRCNGEPDNWPFGQGTVSL